MYPQVAQSRYILHADLDAFYASVEQRDNPDLKGKPVVVGGSPESRGVVAAASYEARRFGIHSALPMKTALRMCNNLVRISPRFQRYREVSSQIMGLFRKLTPLVEPLSLDEAYIDISEIGNAEEIAQGLKDKVKRMTDLAITIGGGTSKTIAKVASQIGKPDGLLLVKPGEEQEFLAELKVDILNGVGPKTESLLISHRINTVGDLALCDAMWLQRNLGVRGLELRNRAMGIDDDPVSPYRETKSVSNEITLPKDARDISEIEDHIKNLSEKVAHHLQALELKGKTMKLKLRLSDFTTFTRQITLTVPTDDAIVIDNAARRLFASEYKEGRGFRLFGVGVSNFSHTSQLPLFLDEITT